MNYLLLIQLLICKKTKKYIFLNIFDFQSYSLMLRIFKIYEFNLNNPLIAATTVSFSSRPGDLSSKDDFYFTSKNLFKRFKKFIGTNLVSVETSLLCYNKTLYKALNS